MDNICYSGGASGADLAWGDAARRRGHKVVHFSFAGHRTNALRTERVFLTDDQLGIADPYLAAANQQLKRDWPPVSAYRAKLLRRNWHEVKSTSSLYAIATFDRDGTIKGGTAWAVTMFIERHRNAACAAYLFDQHHKRWLKWEGSWQGIAMPPSPRGAWTGIGLREIARIGLRAIEALLDRS